MSDDYKDLEWARELLKSAQRNRVIGGMLVHALSVEDAVAALAEPLRVSMRVEESHREGWSVGYSYGDKLAQDWQEIVEQRDKRIEELEAAIRSHDCAPVRKAEDGYNGADEKKLKALVTSWVVPCACFDTEAKP